MKRIKYETSELRDKKGTLLSSGTFKALFHYALKFGRLGWCIRDRRGYRTFIFK
jgi:hypothetical protein